MEVVYIGIEIFAGAVGVLDLESVQGFGVNNSLDVVAGVDDREIGEAGFVEFV